MRVNYNHAGWVIWATFALALMLSILPLPAWAMPYQPLYVLVTLVYWCVAAPQRVGVGIGWGVGLLVDALSDGLLGQNALALALVAWLSHRLDKRLKVSSIPHQLLLIGAIVVAHQLVIYAIGVLTGAPPQGLEYWVPVLTSAILWPWALSLLRDLRQRFRVR